MDDSDLEDVAVQTRRMETDTVSKFDTFTLFGPHGFKAGEIVMIYPSGRLGRIMRLCQEIIRVLVKWRLVRSGHCGVYRVTAVTEDTFTVENNS